MHELAATVASVADFVQITFEAASVLVVAAGGAAFVIALLPRRTSKSSASARRVLARYLIIALELQLAADIIATATDPSLQELGKLAAIAVIRTFLNYFLVVEMRAEKETG
jgi:uncharacterized membrane protein